MAIGCSIELLDEPLSNIRLELAEAYDLKAEPLAKLIRQRLLCYNNYAYKLVEAVDTLGLCDAG